MEMLSALCLTGKPRRRERKARGGQCETEKGGNCAFFSSYSPPRQIISKAVLFKML